ncbi:hypothetical protein [Thalassomonas sp. M1454]|uniref:hypothetical protein n=1 Tax=Thalassomonas sp. M1454 TaxID=2594477 RepID=UPI00117FD038|nr:hypothetical protein [Thalassomonas sp. M1454]TRX55112.1 hypothetical protein FNN08_10985 [Thalassomonas sp. M1454]
MRALILFFSLISCSNLFAQTTTAPVNTKSPDIMVEEFSLLHQQLMPKVAVADIYYGCHLSEETQYTIEYLITEMDKDVLANKLMACLGDDNIASDKALNFGIKGCFIDQLSALPETEQQASLNKVEQATASLPRSERQKSFTQCVNNQTLKYLSN